MTSLPEELLDLLRAALYTMELRFSAIVEVTEAPISHASSWAVRIAFGPRSVRPFGRGGAAKPVGGGGFPGPTPGNFFCSYLQIT